MINRYRDDEINNIWNDQNKYQTWLEVEVAVCEAWNQLKVIPQKDLQLIKSKVKLDLAKFFKFEETTKHDIVAFTRMLSLNLGVEKKWIHLGLTSTDVVDTAQNYLIKKSNAIIFNKLLVLKNLLQEKANKYKQQLIMGRSHGIFGEPTSLGLKFLLWYEEINRQILRLEDAAKNLAVVKMSGSMGNYAHLEFSIETYVAKKFQLAIDPITTQVTQRDRHIALFSVFANLASTMEKIATEIRHFQRSEVNEMVEGFSKNQKGSSSMPHKKNPISCENICGLARLIRTNAMVTFENNLLWHERDISHSSNERIIIPDTYHLLSYSLTRLIGVISNLVVNEKDINANISKAKDVFFSQRVVTFIIMNKSNVTREEIYDFIQKITFIAINTNQNFKTVLLDNGINKFLTINEVNQLFDMNYFMRNVDHIYKRIFNNSEK